MSISAMMAVWGNSQATGNDRLVLLAIADEARDDGSNAFPSVRRIAAKANCDKSTVIRCIKRLEDLGELIVKRPPKQGPGYFNVYEINLEAVRSLHTNGVSNKGSGVSTHQRVQLKREMRTASEPMRTAVDKAGGSSRTAPNDGLARFPEPLEGCGQCHNTWIEREDGAVDPCPNCNTAAGSFTEYTG